MLNVVQCPYCGADPVQRWLAPPIFVYGGGGMAWKYL